MWIQRNELLARFVDRLKENGICAGIRHEVFVPVFVSLFAL